jgi:hypothetical protein
MKYREQISRILPLVEDSVLIVSMPWQRAFWKTDKFLNRCTSALPNMRFFRADSGRFESLLDVAMAGLCRGQDAREHSFARLAIHAWSLMRASRKTARKTGAPAATARGACASRTPWPAEVRMCGEPWSIKTNRVWQGLNL